MRDLLLLGLVAALTACGDTVIIEAGAASDGGSGPGATAGDGDGDAPAGDGDASPSDDFDYEPQHWEPTVYPPLMAVGASDEYDPDGGSDAGAE